jgi:uncharacterized protein (TIGR03435 family)
VASLKPASVNDKYGWSGGPGTTDPHYRRSTLPLSFYVKAAYDVDSYSGPPWMDQQMFVLNAKLPDSATLQHFHEMLQVLLEERFKLKYHHEKKEAPAYRLVVAKGGPKLKTAPPEHLDPNWAPSAPSMPAGGWETLNKLDKDGFPMLPDKRGDRMVLVSGGARLRAYGQPMARLAGFLTGQTGRRVIDGTGLTDYYDFTLAFSTWASGGLPPEARGDGTTGHEDNPGASVFEAIQKQLGLRLEPAKTTIDVLVVDWAEKAPIGN